MSLGERRYTYGVMRNSFALKGWLILFQALPLFWRISMSFADDHGSAQSMAPQKSDVFHWPLCGGKDQGLRVGDLVYFRLRAPIRFTPQQYELAKQGYLSIKAAFDREAKSWVPYRQNREPDSCELKLAAGSATAEVLGDQVASFVVPPYSRASDLGCVLFLKTIKDGVVFLESEPENCDSALGKPIVRSLECKGAASGEVSALWLERMLGGRRVVSIERACGRARVGGGEQGSSRPLAPKKPTVLARLDQAISQIKADASGTEKQQKRRKARIEMLEHVQQAPLQSLADEMRNSSDEVFAMLQFAIDQADSEEQKEDAEADLEMALEYKFWALERLGASSKKAPSSRQR